MATRLGSLVCLLGVAIQACGGEQNVVDAGMRDAALDDARITGDASTTELTSTDLTSTDLTSTDLTSTDLTSTDLTSTDLTSTDLNMLDVQALDSHTADMGSIDAGPRLGELSIPESRVPYWYAIDELPSNTTGWTEINVVDYGADPADNSHDDAAAVRSAIAAAPDHAIVYFPAGVYNIGTGGFGVFRSNIVLRGAGSNATTLALSTGSSGPYRAACGRAMLLFCGDNAEGPSSNWTGGYQRGDRRLEVASTTGFSVGDWVRMRQDNDPELIDNPTNGSGDLMTYLVRVTAVGDGTLSIDRPLRYDFDSTGRNVTRVEPIANVGLENMTIRYVSPTSAINYQTPIGVANLVDSWFTGLKVTDFWNMELAISKSARVLVRGNRFDNLMRTDLYNKAAIYVNEGSNDNVFENNAALNSPVFILLQSGAMGNVVAYNYKIGGPCERAVFFHGGYTAENLVEGNDTDCVLDQDNYWGRQGPRLTLFRNRTRGGSDEILHIRSHRDRSNWPVTSFLNILLNSTGRLYGYPYGVHDIDLGSTDMWIERNVVHGAISLDSPEPSTTEQDNVSGVQAPPASWSGRHFPASLYLQGRPVFWPANKPWPAIGADVDDFGGTLEPLPAAAL